MTRRYQVLVNGFAVSVPYARLPELLEVDAREARVPELLVHASNLNRGPAVLGAPAFSGLTGARGDGVKVAVVDDGVDHEHPFLDSDRLLVPAGLPEGRRRVDDAEGDRRARVRRARGESARRSTAIARSTARTSPASSRASRRTSRPGARGSASRRQGGCHPAVDDLEGVAPRAYIGNYRVFNVPAPAPLGGCCSANSPEIVAAFEAAVARRDGRHQLLGRRPAGGSAHGRPHPGGRERRPRRRRPGHLGRQRPRLLRARDGRLARDGARRDQRRCRRERARLRAVDDGRRARRASARMPFAPADSIPPSWISTDQRLVDVGTIAGVEPAALRRARPRARSAARSRSSTRGGCPYGAKAGTCARGGRRRAWSSPRTAPAIRHSRSSPAFRAGRSPTSTARGSAPRRPARGGAVTVRFTRDIARGADDVGGRADELHGRRASRRSGTR